jgi:hypothetical protein
MKTIADFSRVSVKEELLKKSLEAAIDFIKHMKRVNIKLSSNMHDINLLGLTVWIAKDESELKEP